MTPRRRQSREIALQVLYSRDLAEGDRPEPVSRRLAGAEATPEVRDFAEELVEGVLGAEARIDDLVASATENWDMSRLATVDRNILRLAVYELLERIDVPVRVTINEAIELGKRFSTAQSGAFINGVLDRIRKDIGRPVEDDETDLATLSEADHAEAAPSQDSDTPEGGVAPDASTDVGRDAPRPVDDDETPRLDDSSAPRP